jgi:hypothetical protein
VKELMDFKTKFNLALKKDEGGNDSMDMNENNGTTQTTVVDQTVEPSAAEGTNVENTNVQNFSNEAGKNEQSEGSENQNTIEEYTKNKDDDKDDKASNNDNKNDDSSDAGNDNNNDNKDDDDKEKKPNIDHCLEEEYKRLETKFNELQEKFTTLEKQNEELAAFKLKVEDKEKDALIAKFFMLSDEDKKNVIANKANYTLDDIEKELSVICVRKKVNFTADESEKEKAEDVTTYNLNNTQVDTLPAWLRAVENHSNKNF